MSRKVGEKYQCESCGAQLLYQKPCPCQDGMVHQEICCGEQMTKLESDD